VAGVNLAGDRIRVAFRNAEGPGHHPRLVLVHDEDVDEPDKRGVRRPRRGEIEHDARAVRLGDARRGDALGLRHLALQEKDRARLPVEVRQRRGARMAVGPGCDDDGVLAGGIHRDEGRPCRLVEPRHAGQVDTRGLEKAERDVGEPVPPHGPGHDHTRAGTRGGQRLVGPLAARMHGIARPDHRLARRRDAIDAGDEIGVE